ncbi:hypothetical protein F1654_09515 [Alkalicaulis satelles]|uniref:Invasion associated locus B family protein n=2 Tax=Alkalicaulis satelles TaxID=2609175 RepID=A0A5M6ZH76_9PROT|nr:hypothetical protein F1654_09515 [Alkalicaulis satelles]
MRLIAAVLSLALAAAAPAAALQSESGPEPVFRATHNAWLVFTKGEGRERICYVVSRPTESLPANVQHGEVFFLISSWASGAASEQPSFLAGYPLRPDSPPRARVGSDRFAMYVSENEGFIEAERDASRLVSAMRRGATMRVEASSQRGTATVYEFSLLGVTAALNQAAGYCR